MTSFRYAIVSLSCLFACANAWATSIPLQNLNSDDMNKVVQDFSANFLHTSVEGAGTLGHIFGFEAGLVAGETNTPNLNQVANQNGVSGDASKLPNAALLGVITVPAGITAEASLLPKVGPASFEFSSFSGAVKWTPTEVFFDWPVSVAVKASYTSTTAQFSQTISGTAINYKYTNHESALMALVSKDLMIFEPYAGFGFVSAQGTLSADSTSAFNQAQFPGMSASASRTGTMWVVGTEVKLLALKLGAEYANIFNDSRVMGKLSLYF